MPFASALDELPAMPATGADHGLASIVQQRLYFQLYALGRTTQLAALLCAVMTWVIFLMLRGRAQVFIWAALMHAVQAWRSWLFRRTTRDYSAERYPDQLPWDAVRHVVPLLTVASIIWGLSAWILIPPDAGLDGQAPILVVILFGMMAASIPAIMPIPRAVLAWLAPLTLLLAARFAWQADPQGWVMCACTLLFGATMGRFAMVQHGLQVAALRTQMEKETLAGQLLARTRELQRMNQERSRFFASASHDLRQPVHALALFSRALRRDLDGHTLQPVADRVVQSTEAVSSLLDAMLDISKINAGTVVPQPAPVAVDQLFLRLAQLFEPRAQAAGLRLNFHTAPQVLHTDSELVLCILANFVDNALKHTTRGGMLISARPRGEWLRLAVWDTGCGILPRSHDTCVRRVLPGRKPQRDVSRGLGIGLAIAQRLAWLLGGSVGVRSQVDRGSVFWVDLPRVASIEPPLGAPKSSPGALHADPDLPLPPPRVLLLDDELPVGEAVRIWLAPHCQRIEITTHVAAAKALLHAEPDGFDVLIVDFRLADAQNGIEATRELRQIAGRDVPAILVTGDTDPARVRAAYDSDLAVMYKPVQPELLLRTVRQVIAAQAATRS